MKILTILRGVGEIIAVGVISIIFATFLLVFTLVLFGTVRGNPVGGVVENVGRAYGVETHQAE